MNKIVVGKLEGKRPLGRPRRKWKVNMKLGIKEIRNALGSSGSG
jgi:hypothetical protein